MSWFHIDDALRCPKCRQKVAPSPDSGNKDTHYHCGMVWMSLESYKQVLADVEVILNAEAAGNSVPSTNQEGSIRREFATLGSMEFSNFIGQTRHIKQIKTAITASSILEQPLPHMAFIGPPGTGKTSLAACCANALGKTALKTTGTALESMEVVADLVEQVGDGILFIDEAHDLQLGEGVVSGLLPLLEDWTMSLPSGSYTVTPFTCIMATTEFGTLDAALRSRMGHPYKLDRYNECEMTYIALEHAKRMDVPLDKNRAEIIAKRSRRNPRECRMLLLKSYYQALAQNDVEVTTAACMEVFDQLELDNWGLQRQDRELLHMIKDKPIAKGRCAGRLGMDTKTFETLVVPFLFDSGYIVIGSRGVTLLEKGKLLVNTFTDF